MLCCETLSQWVYHVYVFISYSFRNPPPPPSHAAPGFGSSGSSKWPQEWCHELVLPLAKLIQLLNKKKKKEKNIKKYYREYCAWKRHICFDTFTCCWELFLLTHAEHYQVYKTSLKINNNNNDKGSECHFNFSFSQVTERKPMNIFILGGFFLPYALVLKSV